MHAFAYIAHSLDGQVRRGTLQADSLEGAREELRKNGLFAEELREAPLSNTMHAESAASVNNSAPAHPLETGEVEEYYLPLTDTLRLYAGWLLAWYAFIYLFGSLAVQGKLPLNLPFIEGLFASPLVLRFAFGTYLFLFLTSIHRWRGEGIWKGIVLTVVGVLVFAWFVMNT